MMAAVMVLMTPLQHYMTLSRFQHYAIAVFAVSTGFLLQSVVAWRHLTRWGRFAMLSSFLYLGAFALVCYQNPWLDGNFDLQTQAQEQLRPRFAAGFLIFGFVVSFFWAQWMQETNRLRKHRQELALVAQTADAEEKVSQ